MPSIRTLLLSLLTGCALSLSPAFAQAGPTGSCGNGVVNSGEECDDGNNSHADGCTFHCHVQAGWRCSDGNPSVCTPLPNDCGNGVIDPGEECDDGNLAMGDGCQFNCVVQPGWVCSGEPSNCAAESPEAGCGNGTIDNGEECDDGNLLAGDGCAMNCLIQDGWNCTGEPSICNETGGGEPTDCDDAVDACTEICRGPNFWARRATVGPDGQSVIDIVLDDVGPLTVCGQVIDSSTDLGDLDSAIEALCVQPRGIQERELFRALVTTELNCAISEGGTCEQITGRFVDVSLSDCDALCAGNPVPDGPTIDDCIDQLECFSKGGMVVDGNCATGTCEEDPAQLCGGDFGPCEGVVSGLDDDNEGEDDENGNGDSDEGCENFDDNCADERLCQSGTNADSQICGKTRPANNSLCKDARKNDCTIDDCD